MEKADIKLASTEDENSPHPVLVEAESADLLSVSKPNEADKPAGRKEEKELKSPVAKEEAGRPSSNEYESTFFQNIKLFIDSERFKIAVLITVVILLGGGVITAAKKYQELERPGTTIVSSPTVVFVSLFAAIGRPDWHYALLPIHAGGGDIRDVSKKPLGVCGQIQERFISRPRFDSKDDLTMLSSSFSFQLTNQDSKAEKAVNECVRRHPKSALLRDLHATTLAVLLRFPEAYAELDKCKTLGGTFNVAAHSGALGSRLSLLLAQGRYDEVLRLSDDYSQTVTKARMEALIRLGRFDDALALGNSDLKAHSALCCILLGDYKAAQGLVDDLRRESMAKRNHRPPLLDDTEAEAHWIQSKLYCHKRNYQQALKELDLTTKVRNQSQDVVYRMFLLNKLGKYGESLECANKRAVKSFILRDYAHYYCQLAIAQLHTGDNSGALSSAEKCIKINEHLKGGYDVARLAATQLGDREKVALFEEKLKEGKFEVDLNGV